MNINYRIIWIVLFILTITGILSCENQSDKTQDFYTYTRDWDLYRIPLIEPYELFSVTSSDSDWFFKLPPTLIENQKQIPVDAVTIKDSLIFTFTKDIYLYMVGDISLWCVIDAKNKQHQVFTKEIDFKAFQQKHNLLDLNFKKPNPVFEVFEKTMKVTF